MVKRQRSPTRGGTEKIYAVHTVSAQHERLLGRLIIEWSKLEAVLQDAIWTLLDVKLEDGREITQTMDAAKKLQLLRIFSKRYEKGAELAKLESIFDRVDEYREDRNAIAHGSWGTWISDHSAEPIVMSLRRGKPRPDEVVTESFPSSRMYGIIEGIKSCRDEIVLWRKRHEALPGRRTSPLYNLD